MTLQSFIICDHRKHFPSTIICKQIYPVVSNPLEERKSCVHEQNLRKNMYGREHIGWRSIYDMKCMRIHLREYEDIGDFI